MNEVIDMIEFLSFINTFRIKDYVIFDFSGSFYKLFKTITFF